MSVSEAKASISSGEFIRWQVFFLKQYDRPEKSDWYSARNSYEVAFFRHTVMHLFNSKPPKFTRKIKDFLLDFTSEEEQATPVEEGEEPMTEEQEMEKAKQDYINMSKAYWMGFVGAMPVASVGADGNILPAEFDKKPFEDGLNNKK